MLTPLAISVLRIFLSPPGEFQLLPEYRLMCTVGGDVEVSLVGKSQLITCNVLLHAHS